MTPAVQACFFDLDGTLVDSLADIADATNAALAAHGYPTHSYDAYRHLVGYGAKALFAQALPEGLTPEQLHEIMPDMRRNYTEGWARKTVAYPGIPDLLDALQARGMTMGVLSNKPHAFTLKAVRHFFPHTVFADIRGQLPDGPAKPDPVAALDMARILGLEPECVLFVGDSRTDMETAVNAGMTGVGVTWGFRDEQELRDYGAHVIIHSPEELLKYCG